MDVYQATRRLRLGERRYEQGDEIPGSLDRDWALLLRRGFVVRLSGRKSGGEAGAAAKPAGKPKAPAKPAAKAGAAADEKPPAGD